MCAQAMVLYDPRADLSIGSELMAGRIADTNAAYLSEQAHCGWDLTSARHTAVGDRASDIRDALGQISPRCATSQSSPAALARLATTRRAECLRRIVGADLIETRNAWRACHASSAPRAALHAARFQLFGQAFFPRGGDVIRNSTGTAAGFAVRRGRCRFFCLPGVPSEMKVMFRRASSPNCGASVNRRRARAQPCTRSECANPQSARASST